MNEQKNHRFRRGIPLLPALLTVGNLSLGYFSILSSARGTVGDLDAAAKAIGLAIVLDGLDGRVARMANVSSPFGKEFDSLADVISFGIAPAFLGLVWGVHGLDLSAANHLVLVRHLYQLGWIVTFVFLICGAWRLARFNIQAGEADHLGAPAHRSFVGMPIPAAAGVVAAIVHASREPITNLYWSMAWLALVVGLSYLMVSPIRYPSFKGTGVRRRRATVVIAIGLLIWLILVYSQVVLLVIALTYLFSGLVGAARRRLLGATS